MFYKKTDILIETLSVCGPGFELHEFTKDEYEYPIDGWYWFDTPEEANAFFKE